MFQPSVTPLPKGLDLTGQTALVTGATAGIGLEISKQFLSVHLSTLIIAVRNTSKGQTVKNTLQASHPKATIEIMKLDTEDYTGVHQFLKELPKKTQTLDIAMLNAGIGSFYKETAPSGHEKDIQINYLSNVLLSIGILPLLDATSRKTGRPSRLTWTGSGTHKNSALAKKPVPSGTPLLKHIDTTDAGPGGRYADSKLLVVLFQREMARHYSGEHVIVNNFCPGMVDTDMSNVLPVLLRIPWNIWKSIKARSVDKAGWIALHAAIVAGQETHGRFLQDKVLEE